MSKTLRLQKFLAESGVCSRRAAETLIEKGSVVVNGAVVTKLGTKIDPDTDIVTVSGKSVIAEQKVLYVFHKPRGVVTTMNDPQGRRCVGELIKEIDVRVYPVGRLDTDVNGILLLTNDGELANQLLHPRYDIERTYWAICKGKIKAESLEELKKGLRLSSGRGKFKHASFLPESAKTRELLGPVRTGQVLVKIIADEGRNHFVKDMFKLLGHPVHRLTRVQFGPYKLTGLQPGGWKRVSMAKQNG